MKKKALKMTSQLVIFRAFFFLFHFSIPDPKFEKKSLKSTNRPPSGTFKTFRNL